MRWLLRSEAAPLEMRWFIRRLGGSLGGKVAKEARWLIRR
jgi:hypothetical protein